MQFYELPGLSINSESIVAIEERGPTGYTIHTTGGVFYLAAEQTEVFKKLTKKSEDLAQAVTDEGTAEKPKSDSEPN